MQERIIEIIIFVISLLKENQQISPGDIAELEKLGYTGAEISTAFSWLADRLEFSEEGFHDSFSSELSFRTLHDAERDLFAPEAWGEVVQMRTLGIINNEQIENLIERAAMTGYANLQADQVKQMIAGILFRFDPEAGFGNRFMLNGSDTIH